MKEYVLGFAFNKEKTKLILIEKQKPEWQKGKLNGVGGKVESYDDSIYSAMSREFLEETGVQTDVEQWHRFADMQFNEDIMGGSAIVYCFRLSDDIINGCRTTESEEIIHFDLVNQQRSKIIKNLNVLIPMASDEDFVFCRLNLL